MTGVRRLGPADADTWRAAVQALVAAKDRGDELIAKPEAAVALRDDRCYALIAEEADEVVGLLSAYRFPDLEGGGQIVYLYDIEVHITRRQCGIGQALVKSLVEFCERDDVDLVWAGTETGNRPARALFEKTGATLAGNSYAEYEWDLEE